jgi:hypothetical protein
MDRSVDESVIYLAGIIYRAVLTTNSPESIAKRLEGMIQPNQLTV